MIFGERPIKIMTMDIKGKRQSLALGKLTLSKSGNITINPPNKEDKQVHEHENEVVPRAIPWYVIDPESMFIHTL